VAGEGLTYKLIIVGSRENFRSSDREFSQKISGMAAGLVEFTGSISNENLADLLAKAKLLVQPSFYEGFGLPPLEAMVLGTPALISDIPVFREIYKDYPVSFFRSGDKEDLRKKMTELLVKPKTGNIFLSKELTFRYTFKRTASIILKEFTC
jgi:glycosyltransferase involved in cell wall biosynthesis